MCYLTVVSIDDIKSCIIGIATGIISSVIVTLWFNRRINKKEEYKFIVDVDNYMQRISSFLHLELDQENKFWSIFYKKPEYCGRIKYYKEVKEYVNVCYNLHDKIECEYLNYLNGKNRNDEKDMKQYKESIHELSEQYRLAGNKIGVYIFERRKNKSIKAKLLNWIKKKFNKKNADTSDV